MTVFRLSGFREQQLSAHRNFHDGAIPAETLTERHPLILLVTRLKHHQFVRHILVAEIFEYMTELGNNFRNCPSGFNTTKRSLNLRVSLTKI